jgi:putative ABC transport system permease protein
MWDLVKVAIRNVGRNKRRAVITIITVFLGVSVVMAARGLLNGLQAEFRNSLIRKMHGELQIHRKGYQDTLEANPYKILIPYNDEVIGKIKSVSRVQEQTPRLRVMGLLNHQKTQSTTPIMITAVDSKTELIVCPRFKDALQQGELLDSAKEEEALAVQDNDLSEAKGLDENTSAKNIKSSKKSLKAQGYHQILVTPSLLRGLQAEIGDEVVVLLQDKANMQQAIVAHITGVIDYALPNAQARMAWMDFKTIQNTLGLKGLTSELALRTDSDQNLEQIKDELQAKLDGDHVVETWLEIGGFFRDVMNIQNTVFSVVLLIVFVIVISAIINTSLMTVMERTREIGTLMALGYRRKHIIFLFLCESAAIGVAGGATGIALVSVILKIISQVGISFSFPGQTASVVLFPYVSGSFILMVFFLAVGAALGASFYPSYRASHMKPVQALSSV